MYDAAVVIVIGVVDYWCCALSCRKSIFLALKWREGMEIEHLRVYTKVCICIHSWKFRATTTKKTPIRLMIW